MAEKKFTKPTETELEILGILWKDGPSSVGEIHKKLNTYKTKKIVYTTTLKFLQIMLEKQIVARNSDSRAHIYTASISQDIAQKHYLDKMIDTVFSGSAVNLILQAIGNEQLSPEDLNQVRKFIRSKENKD